MKKFMVILSLVVLSGLTGCGQTNAPVGDVSESSSTTTDVTVDVTRSISMDDLAAHNMPDDCWLLIDGKIYDVSGFAQAGHPGGEAVYEGCGSDATELFETRPMGSGTPHSENAREGMEQYYIGDLV